MFHAYMYRNAKYMNANKNPLLSFFKSLIHKYKYIGMNHIVPKNLKCKK